MRAKQRMWYREEAAGADLAPFVLCAWELGVPRMKTGWREHLVFPDGCCALISLRQGAGREQPGQPSARIAGPRLAPLRVQLEPGDQYWGLRLQPAACRAVLGIPPAELRDRVAELASLSPSRARQVRSALAACRTFRQAIAAFAACLRSWRPRPEMVDRQAAEAAAAIRAADGAVRIGALAAGASCGQRQLERRFYRAVGLTMKEFARTRRIRAVAAALALGRRQAWADLALAHGFSDQAHFSREILAAAGTAPREFERRLLAFAAELGDSARPGHDEKVQDRRRAAPLP